jgi:threonylcarbamoyladenosine tRNA methylthiotransferase MtaB
MNLFVQSKNCQGVQALSYFASKRMRCDLEAYEPKVYHCSVQGNRGALAKEIPDTAVTTDIMVGFPGETEEEFEETYAFAEKIGFSKIHVFQYSPRAGTPAASFENQVPAECKEQRSRKLIDWGAGWNGIS